MSSVTRAAESVPVMWNHTNPSPANSAQRLKSEYYDLRAICGETRIETDFGTVPARVLTDQHRIRVLGGGFKAIVWVERLALDEGFLVKHPDLRPLCIRAGMFRADVPRRDIFLSPYTMICANDGSPAVGRFGAAHRYATGTGGPAAGSNVREYVVIGCAGPALIRAEGMWLSC